MNAALNPELAAIGVDPARTATASEPMPNFDGLAKVYRWMELATFGPQLARCRGAFLPAMAAARRALVLGDGDGRFAAALLRLNCQVRIDAVDASPKMLGALLDRAGRNAHRVSIYCADARDWTPKNASYDLVATHFFLDCLTTAECRALAVKIHGLLSPGGRWFVSEFAIPEGWSGRLVAGPLVWLLYRAFGVMTGLKIRRLPYHAAALREAGFAIGERRGRLGGLLVSEVWGLRA